MPTSAVVRYIGKMRLRIKGDGLISRIIAGHVALATIDTHVLQAEYLRVRNMLCPPIDTLLPGAPSLC